MKKQIYFKLLSIFMVLFLISMSVPALTVFAEYGENEIKNHEVPYDDSEYIPRPEEVSDVPDPVEYSGVDMFYSPDYEPEDIIIEDKTEANQGGFGFQGVTEGQDSDSFEFNYHQGYNFDSSVSSDRADTSGSSASSNGAITSGSSVGSGEKSEMINAQDVEEILDELDDKDDDNEAFIWIIVAGGLGVLLGSGNTALIFCLVLKKKRNSTASDVETKE